MEKSDISSYHMYSSTCLDLRQTLSVGTVNDKHNSMSVEVVGLPAWSQSVLWCVQGAVSRTEFRVWHRLSLRIFPRLQASASPTWSNTCPPEICARMPDNVHRIRCRHSPLYRFPSLPGPSQASAGTGRALGCPGRAGQGLPRRESCQALTLAPAPPNPTPRSGCSCA